MQFDYKNEHPKITVAEFIKKSPERMQFAIISGKSGLRKKHITSARIQKLGLALAGFAHYIHKGRIQIVGQSEISYLNQLERKKRIEAIYHLDLEKICCIVITKNLKPPAELIEIADKFNLPMITTPEVSSKAIAVISNCLEEALAPHITLHGVLMEIYGSGVLITGNSGIGKSECALDLITRGHRLVSDDAVNIRKIGDKLIGSSPEITFEHLEIRGLGIINVRDIFGISAIGKRKPIELIIEFKPWNETLEVDRLGMETHEAEFFGVKVNKFVLPVSAGRNLSTLVETAVRIHLLRETGYDAAQALIEKHLALVKSR